VIEKGTRVRMSPMWKYDEAIGTVLKVSKGYTVVLWDDVNGEWHYTKEQAERLEVVGDQEEHKGG